VPYAGTRIGVLLDPADRGRGVWIEFEIGRRVAAESGAVAIWGASAKSPPPPPLAARYEPILTDHEGVADRTRSSTTRFRRRQADDHAPPMCWAPTRSRSASSTGNRDREGTRARRARRCAGARREARPPLTPRCSAINCSPISLADRRDVSTHTRTLANSRPACLPVTPDDFRCRRCHPPAPSLLSVKVLPRMRGRVQWRSKQAISFP